MKKTKYIFIILILFFFISKSNAQNDCVDAITICGNSQFKGLSVNGFGAVEEVTALNSCGAGENNSIWLKLNIKTDGTLGFVLTPQNTDLFVDFDFYVFGPSATCANLGQAIRCSTTNPLAANSPNNLTGMNGTETDFSEGPGVDGNNFVEWLNVLAGESYFIVIDRPEGDSDFSIDWTGTATLFDAPTFENSILNFEKCDTDGVQDGITTFDFSQNATLGIGNQTDVIASFHNNNTDAITNVNPILNSSNFNNTSNPQTIYIRLTNSVTGCFSVADFNLKTNYLIAPNPTNLIVCDNDGNGFVAFNLSDNNLICSNGNPNIQVTYHPYNNDAITLPNIYTNQIANTNETIWVKIKDLTTNCFVYKSFDLIIKTRPNATAAQLTNCDFGLFPNGLTVFDLTDANATLTNNNTNLHTQFYTNLNNAQNDTGAINTSYTNISNPQTLFVRVIDNITNCYTITTLVLNVNTSPSINVNLSKCDVDGVVDGFEQFNLVDAGYEINGNIVKYYNQLNDAMQEQNQISSIYTNTIADQQTIYVRITNGTNCIINTITLFVYPLPNISLLGNEMVCLNLPSKFITLSAGILDGTPTIDYTYVWTKDGTILPDTTPTIDVNSGGVYTVKVINTYGCSRTRTITVIDSDVAHIQNIDINNLTDINSLTIIVNGAGNYEYSLDQPFGPFQSSTFFDNVTIGSHEIYINDTNGCGITQQTIFVIGAPKFFTPNGDGFDDYWNIKGIDVGTNGLSTIYIFDRFGKLLKQISPLSQGWDGSYNGHQMPADDYWFTLQLQDGRNTKGHFSLKR